MAHNLQNIALIVVALSTNLLTCDAIQCYQCSSHGDPKGEDNCGAYKPFRKDHHIAVDCNSDESFVPGSFCMKITQQGPRGFIWDGRWRQVIRRCASVAETGVTGVCNWGVLENGIYWEECYCSGDECNGALTVSLNTKCIVLTILVTLLMTYKVFS